MKNLYVLTLEPIEKRYTKQWHTYWKKEFSKFFNVIYIDGKKVSDKIDKGRFLDINKTNIWKAQQIEQVSTLFAKGKIRDNDIFILMDAWHPGVTAIKYMIQLNNMKCKMYGYWHAGTYDPADFIAQAGLGEWASYDEVAWLKALDGSFVATKFHKQLMLETFKNYVNPNKIHVVGFPMDWLAFIEKEIDIPSRQHKENIIVFPHRVDKEKCPEVFDSLAKKFPQYRFIKTIEVTKNKKEYYQILAKAKIVFSASKQETFGIGTVEAMLLDCIPIVPNTLSYDELYDNRFKYTSLVSAEKKIEHTMKKYHKWNDNSQSIKALEKNKKKIVMLSLNSVNKMAKIMGG